MKGITYDPSTEEKARSGGWYLSIRDKFVLKILKELTNLEAAKKILDAGCGTGGVISSLTQNGFFVIGNDLSLESLVWGKKRGRIVNGIQASIDYLPFRDETFDTILQNELFLLLKDRM